MADVVEASSLTPLLTNRSLQAIFVGGKGGVGKTTCSCSIALQLAQQRSPDKVLLISTDPAHNISDAFVQQFNGQPTLVKTKILENLYACEVDPTQALQNELDNISENNKDLVKEEFFGDIRSFFENMPGIDEAMALSNVLQLIDKKEFSILVFDTAPTGHTIRLLQLPSVLKVGLQKLKSWKMRLANLFSSVTSLIYKSESQERQQKIMKNVEDKMEKYLRDVTKLTEMFRDQEKTQFVCVCNASFLSVYETQRLISELKVSKICCKFVIVNMLMPRIFSAFHNKTNAKETKEDDIGLKVKKILDTAMSGSEEISEAVKDSIEMCSGLSKIQEHYLKVLFSGVNSKKRSQDGEKDEEVGLVLLPMMPQEVRGAENLRMFSERLKVLDPKLQLSETSVDKIQQFKEQKLHEFEGQSSNQEELNYKAETRSRFMVNSLKYETENEVHMELDEDGKEEISVGDEVKIRGLKAKPELNGKTGVIKSVTESGRFQVLIKDAKGSIAIKPENLKLIAKKSKEKSESMNITPEMISLVQQLMMQPGGIQAMLNHDLVKQMKAGDDNEMKQFFQDIEQNGLFAGLKYLNNKYVMTKLVDIAKQILNK